MDKQEYEYFLSKIADDVAELVAVPKNRKCFEQYSCDLGKKHAAYLKAWKRGAKQMPFDPLSGFLSVLTDESPQLKIDETLVYHYFSLATIHDKMCRGYIPIHNDHSAKQLAKSVWPIIENLCVDKQHIIKDAFNKVKADLAEKVAKNDVLASGEGDTKNQKHKKPLEGEWSDPMTKSAMMSRVKIYGYKKFNTFAKQYGLRKAGNRQLWQIRLDEMDRNTKQKFENT